MVSGLYVFDSRLNSGVFWWLRVIVLYGFCRLMYVVWLNRWLLLVNVLFCRFMLFLRLNMVFRLLLRFFVL